jgi:small GTP-binding protein
MCSQSHKLVIIGDSGVGKSSLVQTYIMGINDPVPRKSQYTDTEPTVGAAYYSININSTKLQIWDTAGQERFKSICPIYYRGSSGCICVFDVTNKRSFDNINNWISLFKNNVTDNLYMTEAQCHSNILLVANKIDVDSSEWEVSMKDITNKALSLKCKVILTSSISMNNFESFVEHIKSTYVDQTQIDISSKSIISPKSYCQNTCY